MSLFSDSIKEIRRSGGLFMNEMWNIYRIGTAGARAATIAFIGMFVLIIGLATTGHNSLIPRVLELSLFGTFILFLRYPLEFLGIWYIHSLKKILVEESSLRNLFLRILSEKGRLWKFLLRSAEAAEDLTEVMRSGLKKLMKAYAIIILTGILLSKTPLGFLKPVGPYVGLAEAALLFFYLSGTPINNENRGWKVIVYAILTCLLGVALLDTAIVKKKLEDIRKDWAEQTKKFEDDQKKAEQEKTQASVPANPNPLVRNLPCGKGIWPDLYAEKVTPRMESAGIFLPVQANCRSEAILLPDGVNSVWAEASIPGTGLCFYYSLPQAIQSEETSTVKNPCGVTESSGANTIPIADLGPGTNTHVEEPRGGPHAVAMRIINPLGTGIFERIVFNNQDPPALLTQ